MKSLNINVCIHNFCVLMSLMNAKYTCPGHILCVRTNVYVIYARGVDLVPNFRKKTQKSLKRLKIVWFLLNILQTIKKYEKIYKKKVKICQKRARKLIIKVKINSQVSNKANKNKKLKKYLQESNWNQKTQKMGSSSLCKIVNMMAMRYGQFT